MYFFEGAIKPGLKGWAEWVGINVDLYIIYVAVCQLSVCEDIYIDHFGKMTRTNQGSVVLSPGIKLTTGDPDTIRGGNSA